ncbi:MAG: TVP38/TMEM64 family protein [Nitrospirae bacterium]|nr:TVP38/TMEM64 family protein [Nitrospirota bacterium]
MKKNLIRLGIFLAVFGGVIAVVHFSGADAFLEKERLQTRIAGYGSFAPGAFILLFAVAPALFLPGLPITLAGGLAFGPLWGTVYASLGSTLGACLAFIISRYFARRHVEPMVSGTLRFLDEGIARQGWVFVAVTRLVPLFPFNLLNYAFGLTRIRFRTYALASWIFMLPGTAAYAVFGSSLPDILRGRISPEVVAGILLVGLVSLFPVVYKIYPSRKRGPAAKTEGDS